MTLVERLFTAHPAAATSASPESRSASRENEAPAASSRPAPRSGSHPSSSAASVAATAASAAATQAAPQSRWATLRESVWFPVATKGAGVALLLLGLSGIGAYAIRLGPSGHALPLPERGAANAPWIATQAGAVPSPRGAATPAVAGSAESPSTPATSTASAGEANSAGAPRSSAILPDGRIVLNLANAEDLRRLPGVGQKRAEAIVVLRTKLGGKFRRLTDLLRVRGIGTKRLKQMMTKLVLDAPTLPAPAAPPVAAGKPSDAGAAAAGARAQ